MPVDKFVEEAVGVPRVDLFGADCIRDDIHMVCVFECGIVHRGKSLSFFCFLRIFWLLFVAANNGPLLFGHGLCFWRLKIFWQFFKFLERSGQN